jgi:aerobic carbon-monoxide dehydrogenase small subunit
MHTLRVKINGKDYEDEVEPRLLLVHYLRDKAHLTGTHVGCDTGNCGACTIFLNGKTVKSCNMLAIQANGAEVTTIEGLAKDGALHPVQEAFLDKFAIQCGYCTPGMVHSALELLQSNPKPTEEEIREAIEGNICMCTGYEQIVNAIARAADLMGQSRR